MATASQIQTLAAMSMAQVTVVAALDAAERALAFAIEKSCYGSSRISPRHARPSRGAMSAQAGRSTDAHS